MQGRGRSGAGRRGRRSNRRPTGGRRGGGLAGGGGGGSAGGGGAGQAAGGAGGRPSDSRPGPADGPSTPLAKISVLTQRYGNARLGWNDKEALLTPEAVASPRFGKLFARTVRGHIYTQPLILADLDLGARGRHDAVIVATQANRVYAFDATDPAQSEPLWTTDLGASVPFVPMESPDFASRGFCGCQDIFPELGITATPVIDAGTGTLYVVSKHLGPGNVFILHLNALDVRTGQQKNGGPVKIVASAPGTGDGSVGGRVAFDARRHNVRAALLLLQGRLYLAFTSHGDTPPYRGWLMAYDPGTLRQTAAWLTVNSGGGGAIWMSGSGPSADEQGNIYLSTGNGNVVVDPVRPDLSHAVVKLGTMGGAGLTLLDWFVVGPWQAFNAVDVDFGSSAVLVLPKTNTVLTAGKSGPAYLLDRNNLGKWRADDSQVFQRVQFAAPNTMYQHHAGFVYWEGPQGPMVFDWPSVGPQSQPGKLLGIKLTGGKLETTPALVGPVSIMGKPGASLGLSSNGPRDGVVWAYAAEVASLDNNTQAMALPGILRAYDATDLRPLWDSSKNRTRDAPGTHAKFVIATVANGRVYLPTFSDQLVVYGLTASAPDGGATPSADAAPTTPSRCQPPADPEAPASKLSETGCVDRRDPTRPADGLVPYDVSSPLWSDGTGKERFIALPPGKKIHVKDCQREPAACQPTGSPHDPGHFEVPAGTVLVKTFLIGRQRIETRLLVHFDDRWRGYTYQWNQQQTEATVIPQEDGAVERVFPNPAMPSGEQIWTYPSRQDCLTCHLGAAGFQLGLELQQLNRDFTYPDGTTANQLDVWEQKGMFDLPLRRPFPPPLPAPTGAASTVEQRARSYLHANCAICHRPGSNFPSIDLRFFTPLRNAGICNQPPVKGDVGVRGALLLTPLNPEKSVLTLRMRLLDLGRMPQIATRYLDSAGVSVIEEWIRSIQACP